MGTFPCQKCGECCKHIGASPFAKMLALPSGICKFLDVETNLCRQYSHRPIFCNIDKFYDEFLSDYITREEYYKHNKEVCTLLGKAKGIEKDEK